MFCAALQPIVNTFLIAAFLILLVVGAVLFTCYSFILAAADAGTLDSDVA